jgi:hypothetical protein
MLTAVGLMVFVLVPPPLIVKPVLVPWIKNVGRPEPPPPLVPPVPPELLPPELFPPELLPPLDPPPLPVWPVTTTA